VGDIQLIIDNACAHEFIIGSPVNNNWLTLDLSTHHVDIYSQDGRCSTGQGSNVLGDPRIALTWLVNELSENGIDLAAGEVVTTGTCAPPLGIQNGDLITADFGSLGKIITTVR
jgi:2-keto-4-pentenoate hydratase